MPQNIYSEIPKNLPTELVELIGGGENCKIERIISRGHASEDGFWYDQKENEFVILLQGAARLMFEDNPAAVHMQAGDYLTIPAHRRHRVEWTVPDQDSIWLAIHY